MSEYDLSQFNLIKELNLDIANATEIYDRIRLQFEDSGNCKNRLDYFMWYLYDRFSFNPDEEDLNMFEVVKLDDYEDMMDLLDLKRVLIQYFNEYYGIKLEFDGISTYELYELYSTLILNPIKLLSDYMVGLSRPDNSDVFQYVEKGDRKVYTLGYGFVDIKTRNDIQAILESGNLKDLRKIHENINNDSLTDFAREEWTKSSYSFTLLIKRVFLEDPYDNFNDNACNVFENILTNAIYSEDADDYDFILRMIEDLRISYDNDTIYVKLLEIITSPNNLDYLEDLYRRCI